MKIWLPIIIQLAILLPKNQIHAYHEAPLDIEFGSGSNGIMKIRDIHHRHHHHKTTKKYHSSNLLSYDHGSSSTYDYKKEFLRMYQESRNQEKLFQQGRNSDDVWFGDGQNVFGFRRMGFGKPEYGFFNSRSPEFGNQDFGNPGYLPPNYGSHGDPYYYPIPLKFYPGKREIRIIPHQTYRKMYKPEIIDIPVSATPLILHFKSRSSPIIFEDHFEPLKPSRVEHRHSVEQPQRMVHEVIKPVWHEIHEQIKPKRKIVQMIYPVEEEVETVMHKDAGGEHAQEHHGLNHGENREQNREQNRVQNRVQNR